MLANAMEFVEKIGRHTLSLSLSLCLLVSLSLSLSFSGHSPRAVVPTDRWPRSDRCPVHCPGLLHELRSRRPAPAAPGPSPAWLAPAAPAPAAAHEARPHIPAPVVLPGLHLHQPRDSDQLRNVRHGPPQSQSALHPHALFGGCAGHTRVGVRAAPPCPLGPVPWLPVCRAADRDA